MTAVVEVRDALIDVGSAVAAGAAGGGGFVIAQPATASVALSTSLRPRRTGLMLVGLAGSNGTTLAAGLIAARKGLLWATRTGPAGGAYDLALGSLAGAGALRVGAAREEEGGADIYAPVSALLPLLRPSDIVLGGWDVSGEDLATAARAARVLEPTLLAAIEADLAAAPRPLPGIFDPSFVGEAVTERARAARRVGEGGSSRAEALAAIRRDIAAFRAEHGLETVIIAWTASTERLVEVEPAIHGTADALLRAIAEGRGDIAPSLLYATAAALEGCAFINGSPQNTFVPGVVELAAREGTLLAGDDLKSGQTRLKSALVDLLVGSALRPLSIVS
jgi:myo-inositol-1-phosphate synthase